MKPRRARFWAELSTLIDFTIRDTPKRVYTLPEYAERLQPLLRAQAWGAFVFENGPVAPRIGPGVRDPEAWFPLAREVYQRLQGFVGGTDRLFLYSVGDLLAEPRTRRQATILHIACYLSGMSQTEAREFVVSAIVEDAMMRARPDRTV